MAPTTTTATPATLTLGEAGELYALEATAIGKRSIAWKSFLKEFIARWGFDADPRKVCESSSVRDYIADMRERCNADQTRLMKLLALRAICKMATIDQPGVEPICFPDRFLKATKVDNGRHRVLSEKEEKALASVMHPADMAIVDVACFSGLRSQELWNLRVEDCSLEANTMTILRTKTGVKKVFELHSVFRKYVVKAKRAKKTWVVNPLGMKETDKRAFLAENWKRTRLRPALALAGIDDLRFHDFRHVWASKLESSGASIVTISRLLGHASLKQTMKYVELEKQKIKQALDKLKDPRRGRK